MGRKIVMIVIAAPQIGILASNTIDHYFSLIQDGIMSFKYKASFGIFPYLYAEYDISESKDLSSVDATKMISDIEDFKKQTYEDVKNLRYNPGNESIHFYSKIFV
jgi:hypothetical protein